jgi:hypothetical protein
VSIGHAFETNPIEWSWRDAIVQDSDAAQANAMAVVLADDNKASVDELTDVPAEPTSLTALSRGLAANALAGEGYKHLDTDGLCNAIVAALDVEVASSAPTAALDSASGGSASGRETPQRSTSSESVSQPPDLAKALVGTWQGHKGETYTVQFDGSSWQCVRHEGYATKRFTMIHESDKNIFWWGIQKAYYSCVADLVEQPEQLKWFAGKDRQKKRAVFSWYKVSEDEPVQTSQSQKAWTQWKHKPYGHDGYNQWQKRAPDKKSAHSKWVAVANTGGA